MYSEKELIEDLQRVKENHFPDRPISSSEANKFLKASIATYTNRFGSWSDALQKIDCEAPCNILQKDEIVAEINRVAIEINGVPRKKDITEVSLTQIRNKFGSWNDALIASGFEPNQEFYTKEELKEHLLYVNDNFEGPMTQEKMRECGDITPQTYKQRFGTWNNALEECGIDVVVNMDLDDHDLIKEINRISSDKLDGKRPTKTDIIEYGNISKNTFVNRFGSWKNALEEAGFERNYKSTGEDNPNWKGGYYNYYGSSWPEQRQKAIKRDGGQCSVCGEEEFTKKNTVDVHHIIPKRKWNVSESHEEMNDLSNLICLCPSCHRKFEGRWQKSIPEEFAEQAKEETNY